jgi:hypothetical protein
MRMQELDKLNVESLREARAVLINADADQPDVRAVQFSEGELLIASEAEHHARHIVDAGGTSLQAVARGVGVSCFRLGVAYAMTEALRQKEAPCSD